MIIPAACKAEEIQIHSASWASKQTQTVDLSVNAGGDSVMSTNKVRSDWLSKLGGCLVMLFSEVTIA